MLQLPAVKPDLLLIAKRAQALPALKDFLLVGGTNIALRLGHRLSLDVDLFIDKEFDIQGAVAAVAKEFKITEGELFQIQENGFATVIPEYRIKLDVFQTDMSMNLPALMDGGLRLANLLDVAAMKMEAMVSRREKKDYIDMYFIFRQEDPLGCLDHFHKLNHLCSPKSVAFALEEAMTAAENKSEMPKMLKAFDWRQADVFLKQVSSNYLKKKTKEVESELDRSKNEASAKKLKPKDKDQEMSL